MQEPIHHNSSHFASISDADLSPAQAQVIKSLARGQTVTAAAEKAGVSPERLVLDLTALCWYPYANEHTLMPALGIKARNPTFLDEQKQHLGNLVRGMTRSKS